MEDPIENYLVADISVDEIRDYSLVVEEIVQNAMDLEISDVETAEEAVFFVCRARDICEKIETAKKKATHKPRLDIEKVNDLAKKFTEPLRRVSEILKDKLEVFKAKKAEEDALEQLIDDVPSLVSDDFSKIRSHAGSCIEKTVWDYEVMDLSEIPEQFMSVNDKAIKQAIKDGVRSIPGLKIMARQETTIRRK